MSNREWEIFGEEIRRNVQQAVDSRDFSKLNQTITDTMNSAAEEVTRNMKNVVGGIGGQQTTQRTYSKRTYTQRTNSYSGQNNPYVRDTDYRYCGRPHVETDQPKYNLQLYAPATPAKVGGTVMTVTGAVVAPFSAVAAGVIMGVSALSPEFATVGHVISSMLGILTAGTAVMLGMGINKLGCVKRFEKYIQTLQGKEYCNIDALALSVKKPEKYVIKDLRKMIKKDWFHQGHLDAQQTCLITSNEAYKQYTDLEEQRRIQKEQELLRVNAQKVELEKENAKKEQLPPEAREVIEAGEQYIKKIHQSNDAIPGEEISEKISRMEMLVRRIFERVEQNPEAVSDLHKMMNYYLPTTVKLLDAYEELDKEPIQGENIISSKHEIEKTLDTLNAAFEKLLDSLFQDKAWDLSSDISVLQTMLAQEGLTGNDFK